MTINTNSLLGRTADITIDRQHGTRNIRHRNITYSVRSGYFAAEKNLRSGRHFIYIIGAENTSDTFKGTIISTIKRERTGQLLLVAAPAGKFFYEPQIRECLGFYEKQYDSEYDFYMSMSCGIILYKNEQGQKKFLLAENKKSGRVHFIKGEIVFGETEKETAVREVLEQTGIYADISEDFRSEYIYGTSEHTRERSVFFLAEYKESVIKLPMDSEFNVLSLDYDEAIRRLEYPQEIILLMEVRDYHERKRKSSEDMQ